jgi:hypothetical protein
MLARTLTLGCALAALFAATAIAAGPKLNGPDYDRLQTAQVTAGVSEGLIFHRGCDPDAVACINKAAAKEIALDRRVANIAKSLLPKLKRSPCRQAVAATFSSWNRRAGYVAAARNAWQGHHYRAANLAYSADWRSDLINTLGDRCL